MIIKNIIILIIIISIIYIIYNNNIEGFDTDYNNQYKNIDYSYDSSKITLNPNYPPPPQFEYASQYDYLINDIRVKFVGLKSDALDATDIPRVISKYVYPYVPENGYIPLKNKDDKPWNRHPINSIKRDLKPKYDNVYYYELENDIYMNAFYDTFKPKDCLISKYDNLNWSDIIEANTATPAIEIAYNQLIQYIQNTLNTTTNFVLKEDPKYVKKIQVVHDIFKNYRNHNTESYTFLFHIEILLYRENKYNGKHIGLRCIVSNKNIKNLNISPSANNTSNALIGGNNIERLTPSPGPSVIYDTSGNQISNTFSPTNNSPAPISISPAPINNSPAPINNSPSPISNSPASISTISLTANTPSQFPQASSYNLLPITSQIQALLSTSNSIYNVLNNTISIQTIPIDPSWTFIIMEAELIGDVPEDMIALYPVVTTDPYSINQLIVNNTNDYANNYADILPNTANGQVYNGFGIITSDTTDELVKQHLLNYIHVDTNNERFINNLLKMTPKQAELVLRQVSQDVKNTVLSNSNMPADFATHILLNMDSDTQINTIQGMKKDKALQCLYLINNPSKLSNSNN